MMIIAATKYLKGKKRGGGNTALTNTPITIIAQRHLLQSLRRQRGERENQGAGGGILENKHTYYNHCRDTVLKSVRVVPAAYTIVKRIYPGNFFFLFCFSSRFCRICNSRKRALSSRCEKIQWANVSKRGEGFRV